MNAVDEELYNYISTQLETTKNLVDSGVIYFDLEEDGFFTSMDDDFVIQAGVTDFYFTYFSTWGVKWYTGFKLYLDGDDTELLTDLGSYGEVVAGFAGAVLAWQLPAFAAFVLANAAVLAVVAAGIALLIRTIALLNRDNSGVRFQVIHAPSLSKYTPYLNLTNPKIWYVWSQ